MLTVEQELNERLIRQVAEFYDDPYGHVLFSYPWGSGSLRGRMPDDWQREFLEQVGEEVRKRGFDGVLAVDPLRFSTASGHGIGKSALVAWIIRWIMDTRPFAKGVVTANTAPQLRTKTWAELAKWHQLGITKHWWTLTSGQGSLSYYNKDFPETWRCDGQTCKEENSESFAGLHAANSTSFYIFDEASGIPEKIWEVREGGLTDGEPMTFDFGNPTRNSGRFFQNMKGKFKGRYIRRFIDSRTVAQTNKQLFTQWAEDYGEDSDFFKVRVKGQFPDASSVQLIPNSWVQRAQVREVWVGPSDPLIMGVDVARFGHHRSCIYMRHGRDARMLFNPKEHIYRQVDTMWLASRVSELALQHKPDAILIDGGGVGGGVVDRVRQLGHDVIEVNFGAKATMRGYKTMRDQMWGRMREAFREGEIALHDDDDLETDLTGVEYGWTPGNDLKLERKEDMEERGLESPDVGDALALTYALPVAPSRQGYGGTDDQTKHDYDPYG